MWKWLVVGESTNSIWLKSSLLMISVPTNLETGGRAWLTYWRTPLGLIRHAGK
jgi:hemolysin-activating ACP:hemolysin acyltransferase